MRRVCLAVLFTFGFSLPAQAFYVESDVHSDGGARVLLRWDTSSPVEFRIHTAGMPGGTGAEFAPIVAAFQTWEDVACATIEFEEGVREDTPVGNHWQFTTDRFIVVYWSDDPALFPGTNVGKTFWAHDGTGNLIGGQIILNARSHSWSSDGAAGAMDIQSVVTALIGKVLSISSNIEGNATFGRYVDGDTSKRTLGDDDIAAITYLYPVGSAVMVDAGPADTDAGADSDGGPPSDAGSLPPMDGGVCVISDPTLICEGMPDCPPRPTTTDGGTGTARDGGFVYDASVPVMDAGPPDAGPSDPGGGDDDGCSCSAAGARRTGLPFALLAFGLIGLSWLGRRRIR